MSSEYPSHLHVSFSPNGTSFKRTFEQFGYDSGSPMTSSALQASGSGTATHNVPTGSSSSSNGNERNKRARSTSSSSVSDRSADSSRSSEYSTARSSASLSETSTTNDHNISLDQNRRSPVYPVASIASTSSTLASPTPTLPSSEPQDEVMSDVSAFPLDIPRPAPAPEVASSTTTHDTLRNSIERFNEFDSHIAALRRSHSRTPSWLPTPSPVLSPLESSNHTTETFDSWDWTHFGASPGSSHASGDDRRRRYSTDATTSIASGGTYTAVPRQGDPLSFQASDGLSRLGYNPSSSNISNSTSSSATPPYPPPSSVSSPARVNTFPRESDEFPSSFTASITSIPSVLPTERINTDASSGLDGRQGVHQGSSSGSSNLSWATFASSRSSSPAAPSLDVVTRPGFLDSVFEPPPGTRAHAARRSAHLDADWRSTSTARTLASTSASSTAFNDSISRFYTANEERHQGTSNTFEDNDPPPSRPTDGYQEIPARARTVIDRSRNSIRPLSEVFAAFAREQDQTAEDSNEAELSFDRYLDFDGEDSTDLFDERRRRITARDRYNLTGEDDDEDDTSHPDNVREIIQGLHNARGLLERGVETARSLSGTPSRPEPNPPPPRYRLHSRLYTSATTVSSNSLVSESAAEHRRTNARAQIRSQAFNPRPNSDEPPRDSTGYSTAAARLRRLIASQADSLSNTSRPPSAARTSDPPSRPFGFSSSGSPPQLPRGGLNERERVRFAEILSEHRHPQTRSGNNISPSRNRNNLSPEDSPDSIFDPVFTEVDPLPSFQSSTEEDAQPPYVYRPPTPPLHTLRAARSRSPPRNPLERPQVSTSDTSARSHPFSNVDLDMFPPGIYRDSLRRSIQASQGRTNPRVPVPEPTLSSSTMFSFGNSDEDNDSDDMDSYFGVLPRRGRERTAATSARFTSRHIMPEPAAPASSLAYSVDSHDTSTHGNSAFTGSRGRYPPLRGQPSDDHLARHRLNEPDSPNSPLDPFWSSGRRDAPARNPSSQSSWDSLIQARDRDYDRMRAIRDMMERYGTNSERSDLTSRHNIPQPHQGPPGRPVNPNRHTLLPWRSSTIHVSSTPTNSGSSSNSSSSATSTHINPYRTTTDRPRQEAAPPEERTPIRTLRQRAGLVRGASRTEGTRIRSMFRTMARRNMGDYMPDELFDSSYEGLLSLGETLGEARSKATPSDVIASLPTGTYQAWAKEDSETRCPICLDDYGRDDPVTKLVECTHWLHKACLEQWLRTANTCPVCRKKVKGSPKCPYKPNPASTMTSVGTVGSGSREPEVGASGNHGRASSSDSASGVVAMRLGELINRARRGPNAQSGSGTQQQLLTRAQTSVVAPAEPAIATRYNNGGTHFHHHHHHYLHIHPPRPGSEQSHGSQFLDPYRQPPSSTASTAQSGTGPRVFPSVQTDSGPRPNVSSRPALSRPTSWFGSMTNRASARRVPESPQDSGSRFTTSPMDVDYEGSFRRTSFVSEASGFHTPVPAPQSAFGAPPSSSVASSGVFPQTAGSSSSPSTTSNMLDTYSLATGELQSSHGTSRSVGSLGNRLHVPAHPNNAGSSAQHFGSFNMDGELDSRSSTTSNTNGYARPGGPGTSGPPPWWR